MFSLKNLILVVSFLSVFVLFANYPSYANGVKKDDISFEIDFDKQTLRNKDKVLYKFYKNYGPDSLVKHKDFEGIINAIENNKEAYYDLAIDIEIDDSSQHYSKDISNIKIIDTNDSKHTCNISDKTEYSSYVEIYAEPRNEDEIDLTYYNFDNFKKDFLGTNEIQINFEDGSSVSKSIKVSSLDFAVAPYTINEKDDGSTDFIFFEAQDVSYYDFDIWFNGISDFSQDIPDLEALQFWDKTEPIDRTTNYDFYSKNGIYTFDYDSVKEEKGYELNGYNRKFIDAHSDNGDDGDEDNDVEEDNGDVNVNATSSSSSSGGCVMNPSSTFGLSWILLLAIPTAMILRRRS